MTTANLVTDVRADAGGNADKRRDILRFRRFAAGTVLVALAFIQAPGRVVADTKLDLVVDPWLFLQRSLSAWDSSAAFGQLQNQAYGYLFPMGPFFGVGHSLGVPAWVVQRSWWALVLVVSFAGFCRLADALGVGRDWSRLVGGLAYALAPRAITVLGGISIEAWPSAVLPWVLVPLVLGSRGGSPRRAALQSALAVACLGAVNAAATVAVLLVPAMFLLTRPAGPRRRRLIAWWAAGVALACAWWVLPLVVLSRYAYPFLDMIENAAATTSVTSAGNVLRGTDHWVAATLVGGQPTWPSGFWLLFAESAIVGTVVVAGLGLVGLSLPSTPERRFLLGCLLIGMALVGCGYAGPGGGPIAVTVQELLDGPLAAFRNVHKFDPLVRLPLALGLVASLAALPTLIDAILDRIPGEDGAWLRRRRSVCGSAAIAVVLVVVAVPAVPAWSARIANPGTFETIPAEWRDAADWLDARADGGRTLLLPASRFGDYTWGRPQDEPIQALASSSWALRNAIPLGAPGATRVLDAVEAAMATGVPSSTLSGSLARAGIRHVLLRHDLAESARAVPSDVVRAALEGSAGLSRVATFGPTVTHHRDPSTRPVVTASIEIYAVFADGVDPRVTWAPDLVTLAGGAEATVGATVGGRPSSTALVTTSFGTPRDLDPVATESTDTLRRRTLNPAAPAASNYTPLLTAAADARRDRPTADLGPNADSGPRTTVRMAGSLSVNASSSAADPFDVGYLSTGYRPEAAVDDDGTTAWISGAGDATPRLTIDLGHAFPGGTVVVEAGDLLGHPPWPSDVAPPSRVTWSGDGRLESTAFAGERATMQLPPLPEGVIVLTFEPSRGRSVAVREVRIPGERLRMSVEPVATAADTEASIWSMERAPFGRRECVLVGTAFECDHDLWRPPEEATLRRSLDSASTGQVSVQAWVSVQAGDGGDRLFDQAAGIDAVAGSSRMFMDATARPGAALDGLAATGWVVPANDVRPRLQARFQNAVQASGLRVVEGTDEQRVVEVLLRFPGEPPIALPINSDGRADFPVRAIDAIDIDFVLRATPSGEVPPFRLAEVELTLGDQPVRAGSDRIEVGCGDGIGLRIGATLVALSLTAPAMDLLAGQPASVTPCAQPGAGASVDLARGEVVVEAVDGEGLAIDAVRLVRDPTPGDAAALGSLRAAAVETWEPEHRVVRLVAGEAGLLVMSEGANAGWHATLGGSSLEPVTVDGWRQAFLVASNQQGLVDIRFQPGGSHRVALLVGAVALVVLFAFVILGPSGPAPADRELRRYQGIRQWVVATALVAAVLAALGGLVAWAVAWLLPKRLLLWVLLAGCGVLTVVLTLESTWAVRFAQSLVVGLLVLTVRALDGRVGESAAPAAARTPSR